MLVPVHAAVGRAASGRAASAVAGTGERRLLVLFCSLMQVLVTWVYSYYKDSSIRTLMTCALVYA